MDSPNSRLCILAATNFHCVINNWTFSDSFTALEMYINRIRKYITLWACIFKFYILVKAKHKGADLIVVLAFLLGIALHCVTLTYFIHLLMVFFSLGLL